MLNISEATPTDQNSISSFEQKKRLNQKFILTLHDSAGRLIELSQEIDQLMSSELNSIVLADLQLFSEDVRGTVAEMHKKIEVLRGNKFVRVK